MDYKEIIGADGKKYRKRSTEEWDQIYLDDYMIEYVEVGRDEKMRPIFQPYIKQPESDKFISALTIKDRRLI
jgi:CTP:phosphocholine cytidylyltransferase-like protein